MNKLRNLGFVYSVLINAVIASLYAEPEKRSELTLDRHCERSEAIQWPYEMLGKVAGLLHCVRNDGVMQLIAKTRYGWMGYYAFHRA